MPNFDGTGQHIRGRAIGRGSEPCKKSSDGCDCQTKSRCLPEKETPPE